MYVHTNGIGWRLEGNIGDHHSAYTPIDCWSRLSVPGWLWNTQRLRRQCRQLTVIVFSNLSLPFSSRLGTVLSFKLTSLATLPTTTTSSLSTLCRPSCPLDCLTVDRLYTRITSQLSAFLFHFLRLLTFSLYFTHSSFPVFLPFDVFVHFIWFPSSTLFSVFWLLHLWK